MANGAANPGMAGHREFLEMQGLGNDFVVFDARDEAIAPERGRPDRSPTGISGIGSSTVVLIRALQHAGCGRGLRFFNADGGESDACGDASALRRPAGLMDERGLPGCKPGEPAAALLQLQRCRQRPGDDRLGVPRSMAWNEIPLSQGGRYQQVSSSSWRGGRSRCRGLDRAIPVSVLFVARCRKQRRSRWTVGP